MRYWAYRHRDGHIHVKAFYPHLGDEEIGDALESEFVIGVHGPFEANGRGEAEAKAKKALGSEGQNAKT